MTTPRDSMRPCDAEAECACACALTRKVRRREAACLLGCRKIHAALARLLHSPALAPSPVSPQSAALASNGLGERDDAVVWRSIANLQARLGCCGPQMGPGGIRTRLWPHVPQGLGSPPQHLAPGLACRAAALNGC